MTAKDASGTSSFNAAGNWSNSAAPSAGNNYSTGGFSLRTPPNGGNHTFAGDLLTILPATDGDTGIIFKGTGSGVITVRNLVIQGGRSLGNGSAPIVQTLAGNITVSANTTVDGGSNSTLHISGRLIAGSGSIALTNPNAATTLSTLRLSGNNTGWTGKLIADTGNATKSFVIEVGSEENLGGNPAVFSADQLTLSSGTLKPSASFTINDLNRGIRLGTHGGIFQNGTGIQLTIAVPVSGPGNLTQSGNGSLVLSATNSYTGSTFVPSGTLFLTGNGSIASSSRISVASGATLDVSTRIDGKLALVGNETIDGAGTVKGNLFFNPSSRFSYQTVAGAGVSSALTVQGDLTLDGTVQLSGLETLADGNYTFPLIRYTGNLINHTMEVGNLPAAFSASVVVDTANKQINLVGTKNGSIWVAGATPGNSQATVTWTAVAGATSYNIKRSTAASGPFATVNNVTTLTYTDSPLLNGTTYYYTVAAVSGGNETATSSVAAVTPFITSGTPAMYFGDSVRLKRPFAKDPTVIRFQGRYLMYYSQKNTSNQWSTAIAESYDLVNWTRFGEFLPGGTGPDRNGLAAPCARVINGKVHLFYQSYAGNASDRICHAVSDDGLTFTRNASNPIYGPPGSGVWNNGRAIDADYIEYNGKMYLSCATRDTTNTVQQVVVASAPIGGNYSSGVWTTLTPNAPTFPPIQTSWEQRCIEGQTMCVRNGRIYMFYGGAYNNAPQQIGCAYSTDGITWTRLPSLAGQPFFADGAAGTWNASESGHPGVFVDDDDQTYMFYQGNNDGGNTWYLSVLKIGWTSEEPFIKPGVVRIPDAGVSLGDSHAATVALMYPVPTVDTLTLSVQSDNQDLFPTGSLVLSGSGCGRSLSATPATDRAGTARITVTATDTAGNSDSASFVLTVGSPLEIWRQKWFSTPYGSGDTADDADADGDGETNLLEFATAQNPRSGNSKAGRIEAGPSGLSFFYSRDKSAVTSGVTFIVEYSDTLAAGSWSTVGVTETVLSEDAALQSVRATVPLGGDTKRFIRLRVIAAPEV